MVKTRNRWIGFTSSLCFLVVMTPAMTTAAQARVAGSTTQTWPGAELGEASSALFDSYGSGLGVAAENGFEVSVTNGEWRHEGHTHIGGSGSISSPWGEEMSIEFWLNPDGSFAVEYDGEATVYYSFDEFGGLGNVMVATSTETSAVFAGDRAQRVAFGSADPFTLDVAPYELLLGQLAQSHSREFLEGAEDVQRQMQRTGRVGTAGCVSDVLLCTGAILGWIASVPAIAAGCLVGSVVTFGAACLAAIVAHEGVSVTVLGACTNAVYSCGDDPHGDPGGGCSDPRGGRE